MPAVKEGQLNREDSRLRAELTCQQSRKASSTAKMDCIATQPLGTVGTDAHVSHPSLLKSREPLGRPWTCGNEQSLTQHGGKT